VHRQETRKTNNSKIAPSKIARRFNLERAFLVLLFLGILGNTSTLLRPFNEGGPGFGFGVKLWGPFSRFQNCDSPLFIEYLQSPSLLLSAGSFWQERPLYIILGKSISLLLLQNNETAFIVLNFILLAIAGFFLYRTIMIVINENSLIKKQTSLQFTDFQKFTYASFPVLVAFLNLPTRGYLWTAHFQIFNILIPVLCLYHFTYVAQHRKLPLSIFRLSFISGIFLLAYPGSNIYVISVAVSLIALRRPGQSFYFLVLSYLPTLCWYLYIVERNGFFFSQSTVQWKQFVWISEAFNAGRLEVAVIDQLNSFYRSFNDPYIAVSLCLALASFLILILSNFRNLKFLKRKLGLGMSLILIPTYIMALYSVGTYAPRLNWPLVIVLVTLIWSFVIRLDLTSRLNHIQNRTERSKIRELLVGLVFLTPSVFWFIRFCVTLGPWS
jgi:hypothetical protein